MAIKRLYDTLVGATVNVNQLFNQSKVEYGAFPFTKNGIEFTLSAEGRIILNGTATADTSALGFAKIVSGHKYYRKNLKSNPFNIFSYYPLDDESIVNATANNEYAVMTIPNGTTVANYEYCGMLIDLTQMFGSTIADYLYSLESATAGAGIAKLKEWGFFTGEYIPYNPGTLESVEATAHKMVGFNQWDEEWENGIYSPSTGEPLSDNHYIRSKHGIKIARGATYYIKKPTGAGFRALYFDSSNMYISNEIVADSWTGKEMTIPSNASFMHFYCGNITYNHDICINLSSSRNGEYEPYTEQSYDYGDDTLNGIFKLDANNNLYADGDVKSADGTITRYYGTRAYQSGDESLADAITDGTTTVYKLTTPTTEQGDPFPSPQVCYPDGTEEYVTSNGVPVGHETKYQL